ncbi:hypothetical protein A7Q02_05715 [Eikenella sp. NML97-A-109]|nr:hypothetical protein A7Q02_05715 [Eikenella sp. NML97-A-109]
MFGYPLSGVGWLMQASGSVSLKIADSLLHYVGSVLVSIHCQQNDSSSLLDMIGVKSKRLPETVKRFSGSLIACAQ